MKNENLLLGCVYNFIEVTQLAAYIKTLHESTMLYLKNIGKKYKIVLILKG